jgi:hypothetical protein
MVQLTCEDNLVVIISIALAVIAYVSKQEDTAKEMCILVTYDNMQAVL